MAISMVQVRGHYEDAHRTLRTGTVTLTPSFPISNGTTTITGIPVTTDLVNGNISVTVAAGNDTGTTPTGMVYQVAEILDVPNKPPLVTTYNITVSAADAAAGIDLATAPRAMVSQPTYAAYLTQISGDARYAQINAAASGDLSGTYPGPTVAKVSGVPIVTTVALGNVSGTVPINLALGSTFTCTVTGNVVFQFTGWPTGAVVTEPTIIAKQDATGHTISFTGVTWLPSGTPPAFQTGANQVNIATFASADNGTTIYGQGGAAAGGGFGVYGDGSDGALILDGTNTYSFLGKSGSFYWLTRDIYPSSITIAAGVTLQAGAGQSFRIICNGTVSIAATGNITTSSSTAASGATGGTQLTTGSLPPGANGPNGTTGGGVVGNNVIGASGGFGGKGGNAGNGTTAGTNGVATMPTGASLPRALPWAASLSYQVGTTVGYFQGGASGSPGAGDGVNAGGGAGAGGNMIYVAAQNLVNNGTIKATGHSGAAGVAGNAGGGGGGQGGPVVLVYGTYSGSGSISSVGGGGGALSGTGTAGASGGSGWIIQLVN